MRKTRGRRRKASPEQQHTNETSTQSSTVEVAAPASSPAENLSLMGEIKMDTSAENEADDECTLEFKPDIYEIQEHWLSQHTPHAAATTLASTSTTTIKSKIVTAAALEEYSVSECASIIDNFDVDMRQVKNEFIGIAKNKSEDIENVPTTAEKLKPISVNRSDFAFDADDVDMQETDTDEDGYSDIDFDDEFTHLQSDGITDIYDPEWSTWSTTPRKVFTNGNYQGLLKGGHIHSITYYFYDILDDINFFESLADGCNKRAVETMKNSQKRSADNFEAFTWQEMSIFLGICLQMGSLQLLTLAEYWECQAYHGFKGFSSKMSLDRFKFILEVLNFESLQADDNSFENNDKTDKFHELRPLLNFYNKRMESIYTCGQNIVLNEPVVYWKGKLNWLFNMNKKFRRNAVMFHFLTEQSGLVHKILIDKEGSERNQLAHNPKALVVERLATAVELLKEKFGKGHTVITSKYYGSYALCLELIKLGTYSSGFLDNKRFGICKELVRTNLDPYQFVTRYAGCVMMGKCRRTGKNMYFYSSDCLAIYRYEMKMYHHLKLVKEIKWQLSTCEETRAQMLDYQLALTRTEIKWDRRLMIYVMHLILVNSFILFKNNSKIRRLHKSGTSFPEYRQEIIASLLNPDTHKNFECLKVVGENAINVVTGETAENTESCATSKSTTRWQLAERVHQPMEIPSVKGKIVKKRCRICYKGGLLIFSQFCCAVCPGMPGLCEEPCFKIWHDRIERKWPECMSKSE
ncbi:uncharacterized protein LOC129236222 [Anastrepha obliqua]|uniref:uncharacterized protein LOC129236222 n=1 Tax=Anastrepha obliqua TaxID=95512 RepID=UPI00240A3F6D|nr:uncharacterized protein LOC129236222 [Anastrepha obliqua]